jgi:hypothetical protein
MTHRRPEIGQVLGGWKLIIPRKLGQAPCNRTVENQLENATERAFVIAGEKGLKALMTRSVLSQKFDSSSHDSTLRRA